MRPDEEFRLPLMVQRVSCANPDTVEWTLLLQPPTGRQVDVEKHLATVWTSTSERPAAAARRLFARLADPAELVKAHDDHRPDGQTDENQDREPVLDRQLEGHEERMRVARRLCRWELGDPWWAERIVGAYLHPGYYTEYLDGEGADR